MIDLDKTVAKAMGLTVHVDALLAGEIHHGEWVELSPNCWVMLRHWIASYHIADRLIDECKIGLAWDGDKWNALCGTWFAWHPDRKTAALMAFCKWKGFVV